MTADRANEQRLAHGSPPADRRAAALAACAFDDPVVMRARAQVGIRSGAGDVLTREIDLRFAQKGLAPGQVNVAYGLYPSRRGQGLATRAVHLASRYAASEGAAEAVIRVEPANSGSTAVALRAGFACHERVCAEDGTWLDWYVRDLRDRPFAG